MFLVSQHLWGIRSPPHHVFHINTSFLKCMVYCLRDSESRKSKEWWRNTVTLSGNTACDLVSLHEPQGKSHSRQPFCHTQDQIGGCWEGNGHLVSKSLKQAAVYLLNYSSDLFFTGPPLVKTSDKVGMNSCLTNMPNVPSQNPIFLSRQQIRGWKMLGQRGNLNCDQSTQSFWGRKWSTYSKCGLEMASRFLKCPACSQSVWRIWWGMPSWP